MKIAVVDDCPADSKRLEEFLSQWQREKGEPLQVSVFHSSIDFLEEYQAEYGVIILDIEMPGSDGMEVAREIRAKDSEVAILFVTNMAQYAIRGYEVNAVDFMVKPVGYYNFVQKLEKAMRISRKNGGQGDLVLRSKDGVARLPVGDLLYVEKEKNYLLYHTRRGEFQERGTLQELKGKLDTAVFAECSSGCLVNLHYVMAVGKETITLGEKTLPLSRRMRKEFLESYMALIGGGF